MVLEFFTVSEPPQLFSLSNHSIQKGFAGMLKDLLYRSSASADASAGKRAKGGAKLVPQSNISYKTIKSNRTLFDCMGDQKSESENEEE